MTYSDWREPARLLEAATGPARPEQLDLANRTGLVLEGHEPHGVVAVLLEDHLRPAIWGLEVEPATDRQRSFLSELGSPAAVQTHLSKSAASAWIDYQLSLQTLGCLRALRLVAGDEVIKMHTWTDRVSGEIHHFNDRFIVSSVGANGLVYFKGGNGRCGWPSQLSP